MIEPLFCIQCQRTPDELPASGILLTRQRPLLRSESEYQICIECARAVREEHQARSEGKSTQPTKASKPERMLRQASSFPARVDRKLLAEQARREQGILFDDEEDAA